MAPKTVLNVCDPAPNSGVLVFPQVIAPAITGFTLNAVKAQSTLLMGYTAVFAMAAVWFILGTVFVRQIRGVK